MSNEDVLDIKQNNYRNIYQLFFQNDALSKPQIVKLLGLSLPTVTNNITQLEQEGKIKEGGLCQSQGGRPATAYHLVADAFISIGVEIQQKKVRCLAINLQGNIIIHSSTKLTYKDNLQYVQNLCHIVNQFIQQLGYQEQQILGIGFSLQGITDKQGRSIIYGKLLSCAALTFENIQPYFSYPIKLLHDVKCAALAELHFSEKIDNAIYVSISEHLGGAIILNNQIDLGKQGYSGALEHLQIHPHGHTCYCGQTGCLETYCSLSALLLSDETIQQFFEQLRKQEPKVSQRWENFLTNLALGLNAVYLLLERDIILGGEIALYLEKTDLDALQQKIRQKATFPINGDFIRIASQRQCPSAVGAALPFIIDFLNN
ncbi:ROK family transcriptional regulator [Gallibacterium genomosp. 3]|uniref:ROK family transcriptional regulator n=1 Tax=Gallibacterium genomosp. 3 TaxID=505345 RepID=A0A1A7NKB6_9PAST|nr:ROK family transcriptional regulator [Gallibacterium genomosp. 3]OBW90607.1 ROK family transcriptional regulator [Gallibacterium genomosp. 3]